MPVAAASPQAQVAVAADPQDAPPAAAGHIAIDDVVNVVGFGDLRPDSGGQLVFRDTHLVLIADKATATIPLRAVRSFTIERSTTSMMRGTAGKVVGFIPRGVGNLYHAIRRGAEVVTLYYVDDNDALHGAVLILPQKRNDDVLAGFARVGLSPAPASTGDRFVPVDDPAVPVVAATAVALIPGSRRSVRITPPESTGLAMPAAYTAATYEELNVELAKRGLFDTVWRQGDRRAPTDALALTVRVTEFKKGNAGQRGAIPIPLVGMLVGKTLIKADLTLADAAGGVLLAKEVKGSKRMSGESIVAARSLAQRVGASIEKLPGFEKTPAASEVAAR